MSVSEGNVTYLLVQCGHFVDTALLSRLRAFRFRLKLFRWLFFEIYDKAGLSFGFLTKIRRVTEIFVNSLR